MAGFFKKAMDYLGLDDDAGYQDYDPYEDQPAAAPRRQQPAETEAPGLVYPRNGYTPSSVTVTASSPTTEHGVVGVTPMAQRAASPTVRTVAAVQTTKVHIATPLVFSDAQEIGEKFRSGQPVLMNVRQAERELIKRLVDFSSGLVFGLNGDIKKVADKVFLLMPINVDLAPEEEHRLRDKGLFT